MGFGKVPHFIPSHQWHPYTVHPYIPATQLGLVMWTSILWLSKVTLSPFSMLWGRKSLHIAHPPGEAQYAHMLLSILLLERFVPPPLPPSLSYFFRLVQTDGYLFYTSAYNPLFCCLNSSSWSSFSRLPCLFGAYRIIAFLFACPFLLILAL